jgi:hypothetical protein
MNEQEVRHQFLSYLKSKLNYQDNNLVLEKRIGAKVIDLIIQDNNKTIALVEFKSNSTDLNGAVNQVRDYLALIENANCPAFLVVGNDNVYTLLSYGWQQISIECFPTLETLNKSK